MHLTTEAGDPVAPSCSRRTHLGLAPNIVLPEPLPDEDDSGDDPLRTYLREIHEVNLLTAADERMLACRMEEMICLDEVRAELAGRRRRRTERHGASPCGCTSASTSAAPSRKSSASMEQILRRCPSCCRHTPVRQRLDYVPDVELVGTIGPRIGARRQRSPGRSSCASRSTRACSRPPS